jgi:outer membrane protein OmpA-like peptidoglycan-associated protein
MVRPRTIAALFVLTAFAATAQLSDYSGYKDPALFTRLPHYFLSTEGSFVDTPFDGFEFMLKTGNQRVEGHHLRYGYDFDENAGRTPSYLQIIRNYQAAAKKIGGQVLYEDERRTTIRISTKGQETWVALEGFNDGRTYELHLIEVQQMKQDVVANADALQSGLRENGHAEVPGIFFDFGKSEIKPESGAALEEVVKLLQASPAFKVWVVGHTDNVGSAESNMTLSAARAAAVVKALVQKGIDARRLAPHGAGPYAPIASNSTDESRARNRRVELVAQP